MNTIHVVTDDLVPISLHMFNLDVGSIAVLTIPAREKPIKKFNSWPANIDDTAIIW